MEIKLYKHAVSLGLISLDSEQIATDYVNQSNKFYVKKYVECHSHPTDFEKYFYIIRFVEFYYEASIDYTNENYLEVFKELKNAIDEKLKLESPTKE